MTRQPQRRQAKRQRLRARQLSATDRRINSSHRPPRIRRHTDMRIDVVLNTTRAARFALQMAARVVTRCRTNSFAAQTVPSHDHTFSAVGAAPAREHDRARARARAKSSI